MKREAPAPFSPPPRVTAVPAAGLCLMAFVIAGAAIHAGRSSAAEPAGGMLLIASPRLLDPNFTRTVVLLSRFDATGAMGLVVNRPSEVSIAHAIPEFSELPGSREKIFIGGPVRPTRLFFLVEVRDAPADALHVFDNVHLSRDHELLRSLIGEEPGGTRFRVYAGHAGWGPGQLDAEIARGDWFVRPATSGSVFSDDDRLWEHLSPADPTRSAGLDRAPGESADPLGRRERSRHPGSTIAFLPDRRPADPAVQSRRR